MQPERAERLAELVEHAVELDGAQRSAYLAQACADDPELRAEVEALLREEEPAGRLMSKPAAEFGAELLRDEFADGELESGEVLGDYRIVSLLGRRRDGRSLSGGRHAFWPSGRDQIDQARFRHQGIRQAFPPGRAHPRRAQSSQHCAALRRRGHAEGPALFRDGIRRGNPARNLCRAAFAQACQSGSLSSAKFARPFPTRTKILSSIAISSRPIFASTAEGEPKLFDFGIARLLDPETAETDNQTVMTTRAMTPSYASPEQRRGERMTTASDVFSLGVVLYELLAGQKPGVRKDGEADLKKLDADLDNIVSKSLRLDPERRYSSVGQFSEDIRRYLEGLPVIARKDTVAYRTSKFVGRHKIGLAAAAVVLLALLGGLITTTRQMRIARRERDRAQVAQTKAEQARRQTELAKKQADRLNHFLEDLLSSADPAKMGKDVKVVQGT